MFGFGSSAHAELKTIPSVIQSRNSKDCLPQGEQGDAHGIHIMEVMLAAGRNMTPSFATSMQEDYP